MLTGLDTRHKIVTPAEIRRDGRPLCLVAAFFDPMHAGQLSRLREVCPAGSMIVVAIDDPPEPLLDRRARTELAASLAFVDYVVAEPGSALAELAPGLFIDQRPFETECSTRLRSRVVDRHRA